MQSIRNKFQGKSKRQSLDRKEQYSDNVITSSPVDNFSDIPQEPLRSNFSSSESSIPLPPPMPPVDFWSSGNQVDYWPASLEEEYIKRSGYQSTTFVAESTVRSEVLPLEIVEKPLVIHESIRREQVEEIQPIVQVEHEKTEIRQITQPLVDKEIKPVLIEERTLPVEILPTVTRENLTLPQPSEASTRTIDATMRQVVEKTPIVEETEKWRIIEEIQPIIYRETIIPHIIRTTRPMREVIVEAPIFTEQVLATRQLTIAERERYSQFLSMSSVREVMPSTSIAVTSMPEIVAVPVVPVVLPVNSMVHRKEIVEDTVTSTTTTTVAPTVDSIRTSSISSSSKPAITDESHSVRFGPKGERISTDSWTSTQTVQPTRAI